MTEVLQNPTNFGNVIRIPISPTYTSSDLLTPTQLDRITVPSFGYQPVAPSSGKPTWSEHLHQYGGIGDLPFLGKSRTRDLYVSRSHRHFNSGFNNYVTSMQPYSVTSLLRSGCRLNDQILPATLNAPLDPSRYAACLANPDVNPYFSHTSKFEVFPHHEPSHKDRLGRPVLPDVTRDALVQYYKCLHDTPRYITHYPDHSDAICKEYAKRQTDNANPNRTHAGAVASATAPVESRSYWELTSCEEEYRPILDILRQLGDPCRFSCFGDIVLRVLDYGGVDMLRRLVMLVRRMTDSTDVVMSVAHWLGPENIHILDEMLAEAGQQAGCIMGAIEAEHQSNNVRSKSSMESGFIPSNSDYGGECESAPPYAARPANRKGHNVRFDVPGPSDAFNNSQGVRYPNESTVKIKQNHEHAQPVWPPGRCYHMNRKMQLECNKAFRTVPTLGYRLKPLHKSPKKTTFMEPIPEVIPPEIPDPCVDSGFDGQTIGYERYRQYLDKILPWRLDDKTGEWVPQASCVAYPQVKETHSPPPFPVPAPAFRLTTPFLGDGRPIYRGSLYTPSSVKSPLPAVAFSNPTGPRIQDKLGLGFKTDAHKRYNEVYSQPIPDLREFGMRTSSKHKIQRCFFYGYHASAFRG